MKKSFSSILFISFAIVTLLSFTVSANVLVEFWNKFQGESNIFVDSCETSTDCGQGYYCYSGECLEETIIDSGCTPNWQCTSWDACGSDGQQRRTCTDLNSCGSAVGKPGEVQICSVTQNSAPLAITSSSPSGTIQSTSAQTSVTLAVSTNKAAQCKYFAGSATSWGLMIPFSSSDGLSHSATIFLAAGASYSYSVTCFSEVYSSTAISFTLSTQATQACTPTLTQCPTSVAWSACTFNQTAGAYQQTRSCENGCTGGRVEYQTCSPNSTSQQACQWNYQTNEQAFCYDDGKKRILATAANAPCTGNPDPARCTAAGGWKLNTGATGWSCEVSQCSYSGTANACGWSGCKPAVGQTDSNCKTPDGQLIINDPAQCSCSNNGGCVGTNGEWKNAACSLFEPTRNMRAEIANGNLQMAMQGVENSCQEIKNSASAVIAGYILRYNFFFIPVGSSSNGPPAGWLERYNFVKGLDASKKALVSSSVAQYCQSAGITNCGAIMEDVGLTGNGYGSSWRQWRINEALSACFVPGIGSAAVLGNGDVKIISSGQILANIFDPSLDMAAFGVRCKSLLRGEAECTQANSQSVCGNAKVCSSGLCCTPAPSGSTCPSYLTWPISCDSSGQQTRSCGSCSAVINEKRSCVQPAVLGAWPAGTLPCAMTDTSIGVFANRNADCRYSKTSGDFNSMTLMVRTSPERTDVADFRAQVSVTTGQNTFNVACKTQDGPSSGTVFSGTVSFVVPAGMCSGSTICTRVINGTTWAYPCTNGTNAGPTTNIPTPTPQNPVNETGTSGANTNASLAIVSSLPNTEPALPSNTLKQSISVTTNKVATCRYSPQVNTSYSTMNSVLQTHGGIVHTSLNLSVSSGKVYRYYVACRSLSSNETTQNYVLTFSVASSGVNTASTPSTSGSTFTPGPSSLGNSAQNQGTSSSGSSQGTTTSSSGGVRGTPVERNFFQRILDFFKNIF